MNVPYGYFYVDNAKYWYYGTYNDKNTAFRTAKDLKKRYGGKYFVKGTDTLFGSYPRWHVYTTRVRRAWS